jgi:hypothetical protein
MRPAEQDTNELHIGARHRRAVLRLSGLSSTQRLIAVAVGDYADETGKAWPSVEKLAENTGLNECTVRRNLPKIEESGWLKIVRRGGNRWQNKFEFELSFPPAPDALPEAESRPGAECSRPGAAPGEVETVKASGALRAPTCKSFTSFRTCVNKPNDDTSSESSAVDEELRLSEKPETLAVKNEVHHHGENDSGRRSESAAVEKQETPSDAQQTPAVREFPADAQKDFAVLGGIEPPRTMPSEDVPTHAREIDSRDELDQFVRDLERLAGRTLPDAVRAGLSEAFGQNPDRIRAWQGALLAAPPPSRDAPAWIDRAIRESQDVDVSPDGSWKELPRGLSEEWPADTYLRTLKRPDLAARFANPVKPESLWWVEEPREEQRPEPDPDPVRL